VPDIAILIIAMLATGVAGGVLAGLLGVGGGIVIVPVLEFVLELLDVPADFRMHIAVATSLAVIIPTSISSARAHYSRGAVDIELAKRWLPFIALGAIIGVVIASQVSGPTLTTVFAVFALLVAAKMALPLDQKTITAEVPKGMATAIVPTSIGTISSMIGIGGGTLTVPALTLMGESIHRAVGTSALFGLLISVPGTIGFIVSGWGNEQLPPGSLGFVNMAGFALIAPTTVLAAPLGARLAHALSRRKLSLLFGIFLALVACRMLLQSLPVFLK
jgi:uncharacterized membrane protein YfcA